MGSMAVRLGTLRSSLPNGLLAAGLAEGEAAAWNTLASRYHSVVYKFLARYLGDHSAAQDLTQETLLRAYRARRRLRPQVSLRPWLFAIALNLARDHQRRSRSRVNHETPLEGRREEPAVGPSLEDEVVAGELRLRLQQAVAALPPRLREVFLLSRQEGMTGAEVARTLRCSQAAARKRLSRALKRLRTQLADWIEEG